MIAARFEREMATGHLHILIKGHAGALSGATDPVCAGASCLLYSFLKCIFDTNEDGKAISSFNCVIEKGLADISFICEKGAHSQSILNYFDFLMGGFTMLSEKFPQSVRVLDLES